MTALSSSAIHATGQRPEKRLFGDRRLPMRLLTRYALLGGRRRAARRREEHEGGIVDFHGAILFLVVTTIVLLNVLDAYFTMLFLSHGGIEANPLVDWVLRSGGVWPFIVFKSVGIGLCVGFLTLTKNYRASRVGLAVVLLGYGVLLGWHAILYGRLPVA